MRTGYELVWQAAQRTPDACAIVDDRSGREFTYRQLVSEAAALAAGLRERGIRPGDRVATALPNVFEHCLVLLALQQLNAVIAFLNYRLPPEQLAELVGDADMTGAIVLDDPDVVRALAAALPASGVLLTVSQLAGCRGDFDAVPDPVKPGPDQTAFIFYTSGTTGRPKAALLAHRTTEYRISSLSPITGLRAGRQLHTLGALPLFHGIGFYCVFMTTLVYNGTYFLMSSFDPSNALSMIERHRINFLFVVPTVLQAMISAADYRPERVASLEYVFHGGAAIAPALLDRLCSEWTAHIQHLYGTTETYIPLCNPSPRGAPTTFHAVYPHCIRVIRIGGGCEAVVEPGETGELIVDADNDCLFSGYLNDPALTAQKLHDRWYRTGDVFTLRHDGGVDFVGRVDDAIRSGGESIYPSEIERVILDHPGVREACVIGVPDPYWGEQVVACVVPEGNGATARQIDDHCRAAVLAGFKRPRRYVFLDQLPRNASNKVLRNVLRQSVAAAHAERLSA